LESLETRFERLVRASARLVRAAIVRAAGTRRDRVADDVEQQVYLALWRRFSSPQGPPAELAPAYLYRAAVRETVRALARLRESQSEDCAALAEPAAGDADPERLASARETGARVAAALARLQPERRRAVAAHLQGFEIGEIMKLFDWDYQRARNLVARGMADLRRELGSTADE